MNHWLQYATFNVSFLEQFINSASNADLHALVTLAKHELIYETLITSNKQLKK